MSESKSVSESSKSQGSAGRVSVGHPVDVASGNLYHDFEDFVLSGRMPLVLGRRYSGNLLSRDHRFRYDATDNLVATTRPDEEGIPWETGCAYGPGNVLKSMGLVRYEHDRLGQLVRKIDAGKETRYTWNRSGQLTGVELPDGSAWTSQAGLCGIQRNRSRRHVPQGLSHRQEDRADIRPWA